MFRSSPVSVAISLVCVAHFFSHFNMMLLPPLLPVLTGAMSISYTQIGLALTVYSLVSALTQTPMGFLVDRFGPATLLVFGVALEGIAFALIGVYPVFALLLLLLGIAGIANAVYHPADYSILNHVVADNRIGKAFSYHTAAGLLGEAVAPATILILTAMIGWRAALIVCGLSGVIVALLLYLNMGLLSRSVDSPSVPRQTGSLSLLLSAPVLLGLLFFVCISLTTRGINGFTVSALHIGRDMSLGTAGTLLSVWLFAAPVGVLAGGRLADRQQNHAQLISMCFVVVALCLVILASFKPPLFFSALLFAIGGFCAGMVSPSRDMLIRSVTPKGQSGKVFGFVSTGFNIGGMLAPPIYGFLMDSGYANGVFWMAALASLLTIATVLTTRSAVKATG